MSETGDVRNDDDDVCTARILLGKISGVSLSRYHD